jgi:hypothetical protein
VQAIATIAYVIVSLLLWIATWRSARHSADALKLQALTTYLQHGADVKGKVVEGRLFTTPELQTAFVEALLAELAPRQRAAIQRIQRAVAERLKAGQATPQ